MRATEILFESRAAVLKAEAEAKLLDKQIELERLRLDAAAIRAAALEEAKEVLEFHGFEDALPYIEWAKANPKEKT